MDAIGRELNQLLTGTFDIVLKVEQTMFKGTRFDNLTMSEVHTIEAIGTGQRTMGEVAGDLSITLATLNACVSRLCTKGYVERSRTDEDRRVVLLQLTRPGKVVCRLHQQFHDHMVDEIMKDMPTQEREALSRALYRVREYFEAAAAITAKQEETV